MNLLDLLLLIGVVGCAVWGAKRGFVRMIMITLGLVASIIIAVHYNDSFTRELSGYFRASPICVTMIAFILSSMLLFALFRMGAKLFFRVANVQKLGRNDQVGGALVGVIFGWFMMGYVVFLALFPMPLSLEPKLEESALALRMGATVPFVYETSERLHPSQGDFLLKMEDALAGAIQYSGAGQGKNKKRKVTADDRARVEDFLSRLERYFVASS